MNFEEIMQFRYACKRYDKEKNISDEDIQKMINAAHLSPTSCNIQHAHLLICKSNESMENMLDICMRQGTIRTANKAIVVLAAKKSLTGIGTKRYNTIIEGTTKRLNSFLPDDKKVTSEFVDERTAFFCDKPDLEYTAWSKANSYLVAMNIMNQAADLGIDSCPIEGFSQEKFNRAYPKYQDDFEVAMVISLGYRNEEQPYRDRLNITNLYTTI